MSSKKSSLITPSDVKDLKTIITEVIDNSLDPEKRLKQPNLVLNDCDILILCACFNLSVQLSKLIEKGDLNLSEAKACRINNGEFALQDFLKNLSDDFCGIEAEVKEDFLECKLIVKLIIKSGTESIPSIIEEKIIDMDGTSLIVAAENGSLDCVKILLDKNVNLEVTQKGAYTPLLIAAESGHKQIVKLLLQRDANIEAKQAEGLTAAIVASEALGFLVDLDEESRKGKEQDFVDILKMLFESDPRIITKRSKRNSTALLHACAFGNSKCLKTLIEQHAKLFPGEKADTKDEDKDVDGDNGLLVAASNGHLNCVKLLLDQFDWEKLKLDDPDNSDYRKYLESTDVDGKTALILASENSKSSEVVKYLLFEKGANLEYEDCKGKKAFDYAFELGNQENIATIVSFNYNEDKLKDENFLLKNPINIFVEHDRLRKCNSPIKVLKDALYNNSSSNLSITNILKTHILNHPKVLQYMLTFHLSLILAARKNILEEADIKLKAEEVGVLLTEIFKSRACEDKEMLVHMLLPDVSDKGKTSDFDQVAKKRWLLLASAHSIGTEAGVINYCLTHRLKDIFQYSQTSSIISDVFYTTLAPSTQTYNKHIFLITNFVKLSPIGLYKIREIKQSSENIRYNPFFTFISDLISKVVTLVIVSYVAIDNGIYILDYSEAFESALVTLIVSKILYEFGQFIETGLDVNQYLDSWNFFDSLSSLCLIVWLLASGSGLNVIPKESGHIVLGCAAIPLSLALLQSLSIFKDVGVLLIIIKDMTKDIASFLLVYAVCLTGFSICYNSFFYSGSNAIGLSMLTFFSATLGSFELSNDLNGVHDYLYNLLLVLFLLGSYVILLNLLIARFSNTHQRVSSLAMSEWSYFMAKTTQQNMLLKERSVFCMLPCPFNLITTLVYPVHWYFLNFYSHQDSRISLAGTLSDKLYLTLGQTIVSLYAGYLLVCKYPKVFASKESSNEEDPDEMPRKPGRTDGSDHRPTVFKQFTKNCKSILKKTSEILFWYQIYLILYTFISGIMVAYEKGYCYINADDTIKGLEIERCEHIPGGIESIIKDREETKRKLELEIEAKRKNESVKISANEIELGTVSWRSNPLHIVPERLTEVFFGKVVKPPQSRRNTIKTQIHQRIGEKIKASKTFFSPSDIERILKVFEKK